MFCKYDTFGKYKVIKSENVIEISELPIGVSITAAKNYYESLDPDTKKRNDAKSKETKGNTKKDANGGAKKKYFGLVTQVKEDHTERKVRFYLKCDSDKLKKLMAEKEADIYKHLKLKSSLSINNVHMFDKNGIIKKYNAITDIIEEFYQVRKQFYQKRKNYQLQELKDKMEILSWKCKFINK